jgi:hypothetical protein
VSFVDPSAWEAELPEARGAWCFAAVTRAVRGTLAGDDRSQPEIAHDFCTSVSTLGGGVATYGGSRGKDIDKYLTAIGQPHHPERIRHSWVEAWVGDGSLADPAPLLHAVWGEVDYDGLQTEWVKAGTDEGTVQQIAKTIENDGLVVVGTSMHTLVIYGYEIPDDAPQGYQAYGFAVWDPTDGSTKVADIGDYEGAQLVLVRG